MADRSHELQLAREQREQGRKIDAYRTLTGHTIWVQKRAEWRLGTLGAGPELPEPIEPESDEFIVALSSLVVSEAASTALFEIDRTMNEFGDFADALASRKTLLSAEEKEALVVGAGAVHHAAFTLREQLRAELSPGA